MNLNSFLVVNLEYWIAKRTAKSSKQGEPSVIMRVAVLSVALSVAVMIVSLAVVFGFHREIVAKLTGFSADVLVSSYSGINNSSASPIDRSTKIEDLIWQQEGVERVSPYATVGGVVRSSESVDGVLLKGVDSLFDWSFFGSFLVEGTLPQVGGEQRTKEVLISKTLAQRHRLEVGDRVELVLADKGESLRRDLFKVSGIYATEMGESDKNFLMTDLRNVQRLNSWDQTQISGYDVSIADFDQAQKIADQLNRELLHTEYDDFNNVAIYSAEEINPNIFGWLAAHNINAMVIIIIMIIVAGFNMATALLIMVMERTRMIGTLKSLGMNNKQLRSIFIYRAWSVIVKGLGWGNGVGVMLCLLQSRFHIIELDETGYMLAYVPVELGLGWLVLLNVGVAVAILTLMTIPSRMVAYIKPEVTLKYE